MTEATAPLLEVSGLEVTFAVRKRAVPAVRGVSLRIDPGEAVGLVGESGSGKTMTAMSLLRLLPGHCTVRGSIRFGRDDLLGLGERSFRHIRGRDIALVSQNAMVAFNPMITVGNQIVEAILA
ncbi:MAG TPA: ATP-binding cassette domain-containing protein, partial [Rugosimonospora sp.]|nr:ATP-binding cassette domain-containing protein [Rugosimonospora sp.]